MNVDHDAKIACNKARPLLVIILYTQYQDYCIKSVNASAQRMDTMKNFFTRKSNKPSTDTMSTDTDVTDVDFKAFIADTMRKQEKESNLPPIESNVAESLIDAISYLDATALNEEGLYRVSGDAKLVDE